MQLRHTYAQVSVSELVGDIEAEGSELASFQADSVEQAEREQQPLERLDLGVLRVEEVVELGHLVQVGSQQVGLKKEQYIRPVC